MELRPLARSCWGSEASQGAAFKTPNARDIHLITFVLSPFCFSLAGRELQRGSACRVLSGCGSDGSVELSPRGPGEHVPSCPDPGGSLLAAGGSFCPSIGVNAVLLLGSPSSFSGFCWAPQGRAQPWGCPLPPLVAAAGACRMEPRLSPPQPYCCRG